MTVKAVIDEGVDIVSFSGDKLFGGPQAGIIAGRKRYIDRIKKNPLTRALRLDKMTIYALEQTFRKYLNVRDAVKTVPALNMMTAKKERVRRRCEKLLNALKDLQINGLSFSMREDFSCVGGGALPLEKIATYVIIVNSKKVSSSKIAKRLREHVTPVIARVNNDNVILDMRTVLPKEEKIIIEAVKGIF